MKKIITAGLVSLSLMAGLATAAEPTLDGANRAAMEKSARAMMVTLSGEERRAFMRAISMLGAYSAYQVLREQHDETDNLNVSSLPSGTQDKVLEDMLALLDGKTVDDVIAEAEKPKYRETLEELQGRSHIH